MREGLAAGVLPLDDDEFDWAKNSAAASRL